MAKLKVVFSLILFISMLVGGLNTFSEENENYLKLEESVLKEELKSIRTIDPQVLGYSSLDEVLQNLEPKPEEKPETKPVSQVSVEKPKTESPKVIKLSEYERDLLARLVKAENRSDSYNGQVAVANVVLNRVKSPLFPNTVHDVIYQNMQFEPTRNGKIDNPASKSSFIAVDAALSGKKLVPSNVLYFAAAHVDFSSWADYYTTIDGQHYWTHRK